LRLLMLLALCTLALQMVWLARVAMMRVLDPQSTSFQRSEIWRLLVDKQQVAWSQSWADSAQLGRQLPRAVIASEDATFAEHRGVEWEAIQTAWNRNRSAAARAERAAAAAAARNRGAPAAKVVGGSSITQQLAKNLFLSGERTAPRKAQELIITLMLELLLSKERILEIYLNSVEWGEGVFGAQAAARHYFRVDAARLSAEQAARLAVMLPAPKRFEKAPASAYVLARAATIVARMGSVTVP
jgi:monofunctional biosynthetic peptidoglycan transglycosylase